LFFCTFASMNRKLTITLVLLAAAFQTAAAQSPISIFKENYASFGMPLNAKPGWETNDVTFQISLRYNLFQNIADQDWDVFVAYSQLTAWNFFWPSNPFRGNTYMPSLFAYHPIKRGPYGIESDILFGYDHRSNGLDGAGSRTFDCLLATYTHTFSGRFTTQVTGRIGMGSIYNDFSMEMLTRYQGFFNLALCYHSLDRRWMVSASVSPLINKEVPANVTAEIAFRPFQLWDWLYIVARYHYGYDENQLDCGNPDVFLKHMVRFGISAQPSILSHKLFL